MHENYYNLCKNRSLKFSDNLVRTNLNSGHSIVTEINAFVEAIIGSGLLSLWYFHGHLGPVV